MHARIIALLWDFDKTLVQGYMQEPLFRHFGVDPVTFWDEVNALPAYYGQRSANLFSDALYLNHMLTYVRAGIFAGLDNQMIRQFGKAQKLAPGVPDIFKHLNNVVSGYGDRVCIEHYVISTGLRQTILGSEVGPYMREVWGCEFLDEIAPPGYLGRPRLDDGDRTIKDIAYTVDHTSKTRCVFEINKGVREGLGINVNTAIEENERRVPFSQMIYVADGPSDIPSLSVINERKGKTFGVYLPDSERDLAQAKMMLAQARVNEIGPADFRPGTSTFEWLTSAVVATAESLASLPPLKGAKGTPRPTPGHIYRPE